MISGNKPSRRDVLRYASAVAAVSASGLSFPALAGETLVMSDFGGEWAAWNKNLFDNKFGEEAGDSINRDAGADNAARIAKIKLGLASQTYDIACFADAFFARAQAEGLLTEFNAKSPAVTNIADIPEDFVTPHYVAHLFNNLGMAYNPSMVEEEPTSWADMWNPAYAERIVLPTVNHSFGLHVVLVCGLVASGNMQDIDGALVKLKELADLKPIWALDSQAIMRSLSQGEAAVGWLGRGEHYQILKNGGETKFMMPKEGGFRTHWAFAPVKGTRFPEQVEKYVNVSLDPKLSADYATHWGFNPTNKRWVDHAEKETVDRISLSDEENSRVVKIDYLWLNSKRTELTEHWNRIVGA